jgi:REP element-mobilizing transposase RayT
VAMPDHIHLLISEPERGTQSTVMPDLKTALRAAGSREKENAEAGARQAMARRAAACMAAPLL